MTLLFLPPPPTHTLKAVTSGSYSGDRFLRYKSLRFKCGVSDLLRVLGRYDMLLHLGELYGPYLAEGRRPPPEMEPKALKVTQRWLLFSS